MFRSLRFRLPAFFLAGIALAGLVATAVALRLFQDYARDQSLRELNREAIGITQLFAPIVGDDALPYGPALLERTTGDRIYYTGLDIYPGQESGFRELPEDILDPDALPSDRNVVFEFTPPDDDRRYLAVARALETRDGSRWGAFVVATPRAGGLVVAGALGWYLSRRISEPVAQLSVAADRIAEGHYDVQVPNVPMDDEISHLADRFAQMATRLAEADEQERNFLMSVSHELRTPLT